MKTFTELLAEKSEIEKEVAKCDDLLKNFKVTKSGLVPDEVRNTEPFKEAKRNFNNWFIKLQNINLFINRNFKAENRAYQMQNRFKKQESN